MRFKPPAEKAIFIYPDKNKIPDLLSYNNKIIKKYNFNIDNISFKSFKEKLVVFLSEKHNIKFSDFCVGCAHQPGFISCGVIQKYKLLDSLKNVQKINIVMDIDYAKYLNFSIPVKNNFIYSKDNIIFIPPFIKKPLKYLSLPDKKYALEILASVFKKIKTLSDKKIADNFYNFREIFFDNYDTSFNLSLFLNKICFLYTKINNVKPILSSEFFEFKEYKHFLKHIVKNIKEFNEIYNKALKKFRNKYNIRSNTTPFPELDYKKGFFETPFWYFNPSDLMRHSVFVNKKGTCFIIEDKKITEIDIEENSNLIIPKAVLFSLFLRVFCFDLFIHGISGGNYEQVTDYIIRHFFKINPPVFIVATETRYLGSFKKMIKSKKELENILLKLKRMKQSPEKFTPKQDKLVNQKEKLKNKIINAKGDKKKDIINQIKDIDNKLYKNLKFKIKNLNKNLDKIQIDIKNQEILTNREYPYFLYEY